MEEVLKIVVMLSFLVLASSQALGREVNPNKLPLCPPPDMSKITDYERFAKWTNCWGKYLVELNKDYRGHILEGEWLNGRLHGQATYTYADGAKHVGEWREGKANGLGTLTMADGFRFEGSWRDGKFLRKFVWPTEGKIIRGFDTAFKGIDIAGQSGQSIISIDEGTVLYANNMRGFGKLVIVDHRDGLVSAYGHNKSILVKEGQAVTKGQRIAEMGDTDAESVRLHFEIRRLGQAVDPLTFLTDQAGGIQIDSFAINSDRSNIDHGRTEVSKEQQRLDEGLRQREQARSSQRINLQVSNTMPNSDGNYTITIQTNSDTASLKLNSEELGGRADGNYVVNRVARAGQDTKLDIVARDVYGNVDSKSIIVSRSVVESKVAYASLNPTRIKRQSERDAVAIIIGVADYRNLPKAVHADDDARAFYDYAIRALGVKSENIKLLVNQDAGEIEIYKAFKTWLPSRVRATTDVYVFYSGHGYTTADGKGLYWFPHQADRDLISKTAILVEELNADILAAKPKSVTVFADACYSGQSRSGETLIATARPIVPKAETRLFPETFTLLAASQHDQISSSSPDLQHGIFSYYLMRGMEGEADSNRDGRITLGEMQAYLVENVGRHAGVMSRKQEPQVLGDSGRVLVGK